MTDIQLHKKIISSSILSDDFTLIPQDTLNQPQNIQINSDENSIYLKWNKQNINEQFIIERRLGGSGLEWVQLNEIPTTNNFYTDTNSIANPLISGNIVNYQYRILEVDSNQNKSIPSEIISDSLIIPKRDLLYTDLSISSNPIISPDNIVINQIGVQTDTVFRWERLQLSAPNSNNEKVEFIISSENTSWLKISQWEGILEPSGIQDIFLYYFVEKESGDLSRETTIYIDGNFTNNNENTIAIDVSLQSFAFQEPNIECITLLNRYPAIIHLDWYEGWDFGNSPISNQGEFIVKRNNVQIGNPSIGARWTDIILQPQEFGFVYTSQYNNYLNGLGPIGVITHPPIDTGSNPIDISYLEGLIVIPQLFSLNVLAIWNNYLGTDSINNKFVSIINGETTEFIIENPNEQTQMEIPVGQNPGDNTQIFYNVSFHVHDVVTELGNELGMNNSSFLNRSIDDVDESYLIYQYIAQS